ncbi:MAG: AmmeMemoRadiSam system protein A [Deltaproteobacteria bacterium]|nr:AmmeMemoRadiSam system protein A [Deltaproteobacteria bacterium]MBK8241027.1 AmmeMemoRadiSam system protein A [Deltaproteobacteria bacterium]MBK8713962.1 AmmeMemoRadiSam system protein A [Deltaproteobacteria bacterium]MBP7291736.1 AmmeMemoRadiSam system protein A [Nannocystaceae bacterium]
MIDEASQRWLSAHARHALACALGCDDRVPAPGPMPDDGALHTPARVFVSWHEHGRLLGCIGTLVAGTSLADAVAHYAVQSGLHDPRMPAMRAEQVAGAELEISVLSPPRELDVRGRSAIEAAIVPGRDGVILHEGTRRAVFLPVVWAQLPGVSAFITALCKKAGIDPQRAADLRAEVFTTQAWTA